MLILCLIGLQSVFAQSREVSGVVTSADDGLSIPGVSVIIKGTTIGTTTDFYGKYSLNVPKSGTVLVFSFVGLTTQEVTISGPTLNVVMESESIGMDEVMVVAFGTAKKSSFTGAAATISKDEIVNTTGGIVKAVQGNIAGVQVIGDDIRIRGYGSFTADGDPLYVVDGVIDAPRPNDEDVENFTVLKDAAATALYGSKAANGVIIMTTKRGKSDQKPTFTAKLSRTISNSIDPDYDFMDSGDQFGYAWRGLVNQQVQNGSTRADAVVFANANIESEFSGHNPYNMANPFNDDGSLKSNAKLLYSTDWYDELIKASIKDQAYFNVSGGSDKTTFSLSFTGEDYEGTVDNSYSKDYSIDMNLTTEINKYFTMGARVRGSYYSGSSTYQTSGAESNFYNMGRVLSPVIPLYQKDKVDNGDGTWSYEDKLDVAGKKMYNYTNPQYNGYNPVGLMELDYDKTFQYKLYASPWVKINPFKGFEFYGNVATRYNTEKSDYYQNNQSGSGATVGGLSQKSTWHSRKLSTLAQVSYEFNLNEDHHFRVLAANTTEQYRKYDFEASMKDLPMGQISQELNGGTEVASNPESETLEIANIAYLSELKYDYLDKYYTSFSFRRDGSSKFGSDNMWGNFWSVGASWRMSEENFIQNADFIQNLKLRGSYGVTGTDAIDSYMAGNYFTLGNNYDKKLGLVHTALPNKDLGWETSYQFSAGLEFEIFNRLRGEVDIYNKDTKDLLLEVNIPVTTGFNTVFKNIGEINNKGIEVSFSHKNIDTDNFKWTSRVTFSYNKNEIISLPNGDPIDAGSKRYEEGKSLYDFYMRDWAGVDAETGAAMWYKDVVDENGIVTGKETTTSYDDASKYFVGRSVGDMMGALSNNISYKGFDLSFQFYYSLGGNVYDGAYAAAMSDGSEGVLQASKDALGAWSPTNKDSDIPINIFNKMRVPKSFSSHDKVRISTRSIEPNQFIIHTRSERACCGSEILAWAFESHYSSIFGPLRFGV